MHNISFENRTPTHYTAVIDGVAIEFSTAMNKISFGDCAALSEYVDRIEQHLANGLPLAPLSKQMNGVNMLRLLDAMFHDKTVDNWIAHVHNNLTVNTTILFEHYFGFLHNATKYPYGFGDALSRIGRQERKKLLAEAQRAEKEAAEEEQRLHKRDHTLRTIISTLDENQTVTLKWVVERCSVSFNVVSYMINGQPFIFCLTNHATLISASNIADYLVAFDRAFECSNREIIRNTIKNMGGKAAFQLMEAFFSDEAKRFFRSDFESFVISERERPKPCTFLKTYFGGSCGLGHPYHAELLDTLEGCIPQLC